MKKTAILFVALALMSGCGKSDDQQSAENQAAETQTNDTLAKKVGGKVGETLTDFATGVGKGVDKQMTVNVELKPTVTELGLSKTIAKSQGLGNSKNEISIYFTAQKAYKGTLIAKALNKENQEIGRSMSEVDFAAEDAKYVTFAFNDEMDAQLVHLYVIDAKKAP